MNRPEPILNTAIKPDPKFWCRVAVSPGCWEWRGARNRRGYGWLMRRGKQWVAHRYMWTRTFGPIPDGLYVCHHCDNPSCVRPEHLFLGTAQDNTDDMIAKGRAHFQKQKG